MKYILLFFAFCLTTSSCVKQKSDVYVKGQILNGADSLPIANTSFVMYEYTKGGGSKMQHSEKTFSTDSNGYFGFVFSTIASQMRIFGPGTVYYQNMSEMPYTTKNVSNAEIDFGKVYGGTK